MYGIFNNNGERIRAHQSYLIKKHAIEVAQELANEWQVELSVLEIASLTLIKTVLPEED